MCCDVGSGQGSLCRLHLSRNGSTGNILYHYNGACKNALLEALIPPLLQELPSSAFLKTIRKHTFMLKCYCSIKCAVSQIRHTVFTFEIRFVQEMQVEKHADEGWRCQQNEITFSAKKPNSAIASFHMASLNFKLQNH